MMNYSKWGSVTEFLVEQLEALILQNGYEVGDRFLTEMEVCEKYTVGRSSVREAFRSLQAMGLIEIRKGRGTFVLSKEKHADRALVEWYSSHEIEVRDIIEARLAIEPFAVANAMKRITPEQLEKLKELVEKGRKATEEQDRAGMLAIDEAFHTQLVEASGNKYLAAIIKSIQRISSEYRNKTFAIPRFFPYAAESHARMVEYIEKGDSISAVKESTDHIMTALVHIDEIMKTTP